MKIVIFNPKDSFVSNQQKQLSSFGQVFYTKTREELPMQKLLEMASGAEIVGVDPDPLGGFEKAKENSHPHKYSERKKVFGIILREGPLWRQEEEPGKRRRQDGCCDAGTKSAQPRADKNSRIKKKPCERLNDGPNRRLEQKCNNWNQRCQKRTHTGRLPFYNQFYASNFISNWRHAMATHVRF